MKEDFDEEMPGFRRGFAFVPFFSEFCKFASTLE